MAIKRSTEERLTVSGPPQAWLSPCKQALESGGFTKVQVSGGKITADYHKSTVWGGIEITLQPAGANTIILTKATAAVDNVYTLFKSPMQTILTEFKSRLPGSPVSGQSAAPPAPSYLNEAAAPAAPHVSCPHCKGLIAPDASLAGQQVCCPHCNCVLTMPGAAAPKKALPVARQLPAAARAVPASNVAMASQPTSRVSASGPSTVQCPHCGGKMGNDPRLAGRKVSCPHCKGQLTMPDSSLVAAAEEVALPAEAPGSPPFDFLESSPASSTPHRSSSSFKKPARKKSSWPLWLRFTAGGFAVLFLVCGGLRGCSSGGGEGPYGGGTITFAEKVDPKTMQATNEGTEFSTGWVALMVRGRKAFGDRTLAAHGRIHGADAWHDLEKWTVDPAWDTCAKPILLDAEGMFDIRVLNGKGDVVASGTVHIHEK